ncbi:MAG: DUF192 domain-containing protein [Dehalobacterium sp.]
MSINSEIKIINKSSGEIIGNRIKYAGTFLLRLKGLLFCKSLSPGEGLLLYPCSSVHSMGMRIPIDVVFLDQDLHVLNTVSDMKPGLTARQKGASYTLELKAGTIKNQGIGPGDIFTLESGPEFK